MKDMLPAPHRKDGKGIREDEMEKEKDPVSAIVFWHQYCIIDTMGNSCFRVI